MLILLYNYLASSVFPAIASTLLTVVATILYGFVVILVISSLITAVVGGNSNPLAGFGTMLFGGGRRRERRGPGILTRIFSLVYRLFMAFSKFIRRVYISSRRYFLSKGISVGKSNLYAFLIATLVVLVII